ncbi:ABC transporter permease [Agromyces larvae]|uniref:ABC transporter permease n=1 Tax=Agromyces larvae TaxID=2929802 RepID=A0ABY4C167_9MICO|nr:ABC transporter permease [Agromyces larvae]UOE42520.1 ABC transporter permease [Agromyces larvae]
MPRADAVRTAPPAAGRAPHAPHTPIGRLVGVALALAAVVAVVVLAFAWPSVTAEPRDLPIAIVGTDQAIDAVEAAIDEHQPGAVALQSADDRSAAVDAIEQRDVYGAIVLGEHPEVLTSSAASLPVSQMLTGIGQTLEAQINARAAAEAAAAGAPVAPPHIDVPATDVVPLADSDPRGSGLASAMFPLVMGGMIGGIAISIAIIGALRRVVAVAIYSVVGGVALSGILGGWFGSLQGEFWPDAAAIALALAAIAAPITGFVALIGRAGIAVGPIVMMLFANPISSSTMPAEFLPAPWGEVGQWFPPGAAATLVRELSYFPNADTTFPWLVLGAWTVGGLLLSVVGHFRTAGGAEPDAIAAHEDDPAVPEPLPESVPVPA